MFFDDDRRAAVRLHLEELGKLHGFRLHETNRDIGFEWERECVEILKQKYPGKVFYKHKGVSQEDVRACGKSIQCKSRAVNDAGRFSISYTRRANQYTKETVQFFALRYGDATYVVPYAALCDSNGVLKTSVHVRELWKYRDRWDLIGCDSDSTEECDSQPTLPGFEE